jgi:POT family proton-dependent oligopeptide transporter
MLLATIIFWSGRYRFVHIPAGGSHFVREVFSTDGLAVIARLSVLYLFVAMFWALFDQTASSWVLQAEKMDRTLFGFELLSSQLQAANPLLVMLLIPVFTYLIYPAINRVFTLSPLRKISIGMFITVLAFAISAIIQQQIDAGFTPNISWQILAYVVLTSAEVMISITCLEFSYTQAPVKMKSFIMAFFMMSIAIGNLFTSAVNFFIENDDGSSKLEGADYFWFFTLMMLVTATLFIFVAKTYREKTFIQKEST